MLRTCLVLCGFVLSGPALADGTAAFCADRWEANYVMREACQTEQAIAAFSLKTFIEQIRNDKEVSKIFALCVSQWREERFNTLNWVMASSCFDSNYEAYKRISNIR